MNKKKTIKIIILTIVTIIIGATSIYLLDFDYSTVETNNTQINNEPPKSDIEVAVEAGMEVGEIAMEEIQAKKEENEQELTDRKPIWVFKIGEPFDNRKSIAEEIKSIKFEGTFSIFQRSRNEYVMIYKTDQPKDDMEDTLEDLKMQLGLKIEIIDIQCREKISKSFIKTKAIKDIDCYKCD